MFYKLLDSGEGEKLEQWGEYVLIRPDPQIIWQKSLPSIEWEKADAVFKRTQEDKGEWTKKNSQIPDKWVIDTGLLKLEAKLTPFKHTGIFPEQNFEWEWLHAICSTLDSQASVLNLFGYTGAASLICAKAGVKVVHVDGSRPTIGWARENQKLSGLEDKPIRWMLDDVVKFVGREVRRGSKYKGIVLDPPAFGHGPAGETWQFNKSLPKLMQPLKQLLADDLQFVIINAYAISTSALTLGNLLADLTSDRSGKIETGELVIDQQNSDRKLSTGIWARWSK